MPPKMTSMRKQKKTKDNSRELIPRPLSQTPPADPPSVVGNPVRKIVVDLFLSVPGAAPGTLNLTIGTIRNQILGQTGLPVNKVNFQIRLINAWITGLVGGAAPNTVSLKLVDLAYQFEVRDDPAPYVNARVGIWYPKSIMKTVLATDADAPICTIFQTGSTTNVGTTVRVHCMYWGTS